MSILLGNKLRSLREEKQLPQRQLAAVLEIDTATYCKIEKGDRRAKREQVMIIADFMGVAQKDLLTLWSADKVYEIIADEDDASQILNMVTDCIVDYNKKKMSL